MDRQLSLFDAENSALTGLAGLEALISAAMNRAAAASPLSREEIVDRMNRLSRLSGKPLTRGNVRRISLATLEKWLSANNDSPPPLRAVEAFMRAVGSVEPLAVWLGLHGCEVMGEEDRMYRDLGKSTLRRKEAAETARTIESKLRRRQS